MKPPETAEPVQTELPAPEFDFNAEVGAQAQAATSPDAAGLPEGLSPPEGTPPAEAEPAAFLTYGDRTFKTQADLLAYVGKLEQAQAYRQGAEDLMAPAAAAAPAEPEIDPADLIFEDPKKALELHAKKMRAEWEAERRLDQQKTQAENARKAVWDGFYTAHPDLARSRELVDLIYAKHKNSIGELPIDQALPALAKETRKYINGLRDSADGGRELPSDPAVTSGTGGVKTAGTKPAPAPTTLVDELRAIRNRKSG